MSWKLTKPTISDDGKDQAEYWENNLGITVKVHEKDGFRKLYIKKGLPRVTEPEVSSLDEDTLNLVFLKSRRLCFCCGSDDNIGIAICVRPSHITDQERQKQSEEQKLLNVSKSSTSTSSTSTSEYYEPYAKNSELTDSVPSLDSLNNVRLVVDLVPCYICVNCRRAGEAGTSNERYKYHASFEDMRIKVPSPQERNLKNKYCQRNGFTIRYRGEDGEYYSITDRIVLFRSNDEATTYEHNLFQQLALLVTPTKFNILNESKHLSDFSQTLATYVRQVIPTLLRAAAKLMVKGGKVEVREMQAFEPSYEYSLIIIRGALHILNKYPQVREILIRSVYQWAYNPFSTNAKTLFSHWMDPLWIATLCGIPFSHIREPLTLYLFHILASNYCPDDDRMEKELNVKLYLKRVFNEGRSRNISLEFLYTLAFTGVIYTEITTLGHSGLIELLNRYSCYLPQEKLVSVWREMTYVNDNIISLEPIEDVTLSGASKPGLFRHLGLGDKNADTPQTIAHIYKFLNYARQFGLKMENQIVPTHVINKICSTSFMLSTSINTSAIKRHDELKTCEQERLRQLKEIHTGSVPLDSTKGAHRLTELKCGYPLCGRTFSSIRNLKHHLSEAWNIQSNNPAFSLNELHRRACGKGSIIECTLEKHDIMNHLDRCIERSDLTPETIMNEKITCCPVKICPKYNVKMSPGELKEHMASYGVIPFWTPGMNFGEHKKEEGEHEKEKVLNSIFDNPGICIVCQDKGCSEILLQCGHLNMCSECKVLWTSRRNDCPTCRSKIDASITIASFKVSPEKDTLKVYPAGSVD